MNAVATHAKMSVAPAAGRLKVRATRRVIGRINCCDALRCSGPHARYTDRANEFITLAERSG